MNTDRPVDRRAGLAGVWLPDALDRKPLIRHQRLVWRLTLSIGSHLEAHPDQGEAFGSPLDVDQRHILTDTHVHGATGIVVEVLSQGTRKRDLTIKRRLFDREGVREYWIVDPDRNSVAVYRRRDDGSFPLATTLEAPDADTLTTPLLPGWALQLERLFRP